MAGKVTPHGVGDGLAVDQFERLLRDGDLLDHRLLFTLFVIVTAVTALDFLHGVTFFFFRTRIEHDPSDAVEFLGRVRITKRQPFEATLLLTQVFLAEFLDPISSDVRGQGLDEEGRLMDGLVAQFTTFGGHQVEDTQDFIAPHGFSFFLFNHATGTVTVVLVDAFQGEFVKDAGLDVFDPLFVGRLPRGHDPLSDGVSNLGHIALFEPLFTSVEQHKMSGHADLKILLVLVVPLLDL